MAPPPIKKRKSLPRTEAGLALPATVNRELIECNWTMRRLSDHEIHILSVVAKHDRICIGLPVSAEWAPIVKTLALLARPNPGMLIEEQTDDGPAYSLSLAGRAKLAE